MRPKPFHLIALCLAAASLGACSGTWLMYDTGQKDHIYFKDNLFTNTFSFSMIPDQEMEMTTLVYLMGRPSERERSYTVEALPCREGETLLVGGVEQEVLTAEQGTDYEIGGLSFPAGAVTSELRITLRRNPRMAGGRYCKIALRLQPNEDFDVLPYDGFRISEILNPVYELYVTDGEPACPTWWRPANNKPEGWNFYLGSFYPDKYRKFLSLFHETETTCPAFYLAMEDMFGRNLDTPNVRKYGDPKLSDEKNAEKMLTMFWIRNYKNAWARYVFIPLYKYYIAYYAEHPDDPHYEKMGTEYVNLTGMTGWGNPMEGRYGLLD